MGQLEPPSSRSFSKSSTISSLFFIGQDSHGNWVVQDQQHLCGGLFVERADALRFALFENGNRPQAVVPVSGTFELDMSGTASVLDHPAIHADASGDRRIA